MNYFIRRVSVHFISVALFVLHALSAHVILKMEYSNVLKKGL